MGLFKGNLRFINLWPSFVFLILMAQLILGQSPTPDAKLAKIEVVGLKNYTPEQVINSSGLKTGQVINETILNEASQKLMGTGLFVKLSYRYQTKNNQAVVTFQIEEIEGGIPVIFDNFVWFTDKELVTVIGKYVPSFNGTLPETEGAVNSVIHVLEDILQERKIAGKVEHMPLVDIIARRRAHVFSVTGVVIPICGLHFQGNNVIKEETLLASSKPIFENKYSRDWLSGFIQNDLLQLYFQIGYLRAKPLPAIVKTVNDNKCKDGIDITISIEEGKQYHWDKAEWEGNRALTVNALEDALGMKPGDVADQTKIDKGLKSLSEAYGRHGFIHMRSKKTPRFDDTNARVSYRITVDEGAQYRMGDLTITGLSELEINALKEIWKLEKGSIYDASYPRLFIKEALKAGRVPRKKKWDQKTKSDRDKLTVDVIIEFKDMDPNEIK
jgi:outer membrane protein assembly factor BamA